MYQEMASFGNSSISFLIHLKRLSNSIFSSTVSDCFSVGLN